MRPAAAARAARSTSASPCLPLSTSTPRRPARWRAEHVEPQVVADHRESRRRSRRPPCARELGRRARGRRGRRPATACRGSGRASPSRTRGRPRSRPNRARTVRRDPPAIAMHADQRGAARTSRNARLSVSYVTRRASRRSRPRPPCPGRRPPRGVSRRWPAKSGERVVRGEDVERLARKRARGVRRRGRQGAMEAVRPGSSTPSRAPQRAGSRGSSTRCSSRPGTGSPDASRSASASPAAGTARRRRR